MEGSLIPSIQRMDREEPVVPTYHSDRIKVYRKLGLGCYIHPRPTHTPHSLVPKS